MRTTRPSDAGASEEQQAAWDRKTAMEDKEIDELLHWVVIGGGPTGVGACRGAIVAIFLIAVIVILIVTVRPPTYLPLKTAP